MKYTFEPWTSGPLSGLKCTGQDGRVSYLYFNPSDTDSEGQANAFVYQGEHGDPAKDHPLHHYAIGKAVAS